MAPKGYYIGKYDQSGTGAAASGDLDYGQTVAIYDASGNKIDYTANPDVVYNYYPFSVLTPNNAYSARVEIPMKDNSVQGKIEIAKVGERFVGFKEVDSKYGPVLRPVYEMRPLPGAEFEILAATDILLGDGLSLPLVFDKAGNPLPMTLTEFGHNKFPNALRVEENKMPDGTEVYFISEASVSENNQQYAKLYSAMVRGTEYSLQYSRVREDGFEEVYDVSFEIEFAAGGWNYSDISITKEIIAPDYVPAIPVGNMLVLQNGNAIVPLESAAYPNGNTAELYVDPVDQVNPVFPTEARKKESTFKAAIVPAPKYDYIDSETPITATPSDLAFVDTGTEGMHLYTDGTNYEIAIINGAGEEEFVPCPESGFEYTNEPTLPEGYTLSVVGNEYIITSDEDPEVVLVAVEGNEARPQGNKRGNGKYDDRPAEIPDGWSVVDEQESFCLITDGTEYKVWIIDFLQGTERFVSCDVDGVFYKSHTQMVSLLLTQHNNSPDGWALAFDGILFTNQSVGEEYALASFVNPFADAQPEIVDGVGCNIEENGDTLRIEVPMPTPSAYFQLDDGTRVSIAYIGGYTKTIIRVPEGVMLPTISHQGNPLNYAAGLSAQNPYIEATYGSGNYIRTTLVMPSQEDGEEHKIIEIVSNAEKEADAFLVDYEMGHKSFSIYQFDPDALDPNELDPDDPRKDERQRRGILTISSIAKTLRFPTGALIESMITDGNGNAVSGLLPLGDYIVREKNAPLGFEASNTTYPVKLEYEGQYVPLVWGAAAVENKALSIQLDLKKVFQEDIHSEAYIPKAGAVFGIFARDAISAHGSPGNPDAVSTNTAGRDALIHYAATDENGLILQNITLPFGEYYVQEIETLDGYQLNPTKFPFRADETALSDLLTFQDDVLNYTAKLVHTGLSSVELEYRIAKQLPGLRMMVNGRAFDTSVATEFIQGDAKITCALESDISVVRIQASKYSPLTVEWGNGTMLTVNTGDLDYTAQFGGDLTNLQVNAGSGSNIALTNNGTGIAAAYNPIIAYTGYSVNIDSAYVESDTKLSIADRWTAALRYDSASGKRVAIIEYHDAEDMPLFYDPYVDTIEQTEGEMITLSGANAVDGKPIPDLPIEVIAENGAVIFSGRTDGAGNVHFGMPADGKYTYNVGSMDEWKDAQPYAFTVDTEGKATGIFHFRGIPLNARERPYFILPDMVDYDGQIIIISLDDLLGPEAFTVGSDAPHALLFGAKENLITAAREIIRQIFPTKETTIDQIALVLAQSLTYARSDIFMAGLPVKINASSEGGISSEIENDVDIMHITKTDVTDGAPVADAIIEIYKENGDRYYTGKTPEDGILEFQKPPAGKYTFQETVAPDGYVLNEEIFEFEVQDNGQVVGTLGITNEKEEEPPPVAPPLEDIVDYRKFRFARRISALGRRQHAGIHIAARRHPSDMHGDGGAGRSEGRVVRRSRYKLVRVVRRAIRRFDNDHELGGGTLRFRSRGRLARAADVGQQAYLRQHPHG